MNFIPLSIGWVVGINILQETTQVVVENSTSETTLQNLSV